MDKKVSFHDYGFAVALEQGKIKVDGLPIHICFFNDECFAIDHYGELSMNLTDEMLEWYLANKCSDAGAREKDQTITFTEVWYDTTAGVLSEIKRRETTYSDRLIREFIEPSPYLPEDDSKGIIPSKTEMPF